jgi:hypothetical protein
MFCFLGSQRFNESLLYSGMGHCVIGLLVPTNHSGTRSHIAEER